MHAARCSADMSNPGLHPCVFFDRDGIVNHPPRPEQRYVTRAEDFHLLDGFTDALRLVLHRGYRAVIVTNQSGITRGRMTHADLDLIHAKLMAALRVEGLDVHDILVCDSSDDQHPNRKPNPGLLLEAARRHALDLGRSWMVGDQEKDVTAGRRAGVAVTVKVKPAGTPTHADHRVDDMPALVSLLERLLPVVPRG